MSTFKNFDPVEFAKRYKVVREENPYASRAKLNQLMGCGGDTLIRLEKAGYIKLPPRQNASIAGTHSAALARKSGRNFVISRKRQA